MSHDNFQPPEYDEPEKDDDDRMYGALSDLAGLDTHDTNLRDHPKAYEVLERLMTHAYAEGRKDERMEWADVLAALRACLNFIRDEPSMEANVAHYRRCVVDIAAWAAITKATGSAA